METKIIVDFTGFVLDEVNSFYCHLVYRKGNEYICITTPDNIEDEYYDVHSVHIEDNEIMEDEYICTFYDRYDLLNRDYSLKEGPIEVIKENGI